MTGLTHEELLGRFVAARESGDVRRAATHWERLVLRHRDHVDVWVRAWRSPAAGRRLPAGEVADARRRTLIHALLRTITTFDGDTLAAFRAELRRCAADVCEDAYRALLDFEGGPARGRAERLGPRVAPTPSVGGEPDGPSVALATLPEECRTVLELDRRGLPGETIAARLGMPAPQVDELRGRALRLLLSRAAVDV